MTTFSSDTYTINASPDQIDQFLSNLTHLEHLLPKDRIENVKLTEDRGSFKIKGLAEIDISVEEHSSASVIYKNNLEKPFPFKLEVKMSGEGDSTDCSVHFHADINSFMGMMMKTPLTNFLNSLGKNLNKYFQSK